ncbi:MAG: hypothetical protein Q9O24_03875 [Gammaproteobacteria bacterium]|nr:hypothetical protein [Gammaproteobacteria bacterium]
MGQRDNRFALSSTERLAAWLQHNLLPDALAADDGYLFLLRFNTLAALLTAFHATPVKKQDGFLHTLPKFKHKHQQQHHHRTPQKRRPAPCRSASPRRENIHRHRTRTLGALAQQPRLRSGYFAA